MACNRLNEMIHLLQKIVKEISNNKDNIRKIIYLKIFYENSFVNFNYLEYSNKYIKRKDNFAIIGNNFQMFQAVFYFLFFFFLV